ncbi:HNH endonuclease signature motif containing protein, partial [Jiangella rhizosphaerae]
ALQLVEDFPDTHAALSAGTIDLRRARVVTDELGGQDPHVRARVEAAVLPKAPGLDSVALRKLIKQLLHELAPVEAADRYEAARERRYVVITPASDGMAHLEARLPAADAAALDTALNAAAADAKRADAAAGVPARTKDQRRADALAELGWAALTACADGTTAPLSHTAGVAGSADDSADRASAGMAGSAGTAGSAGGAQPSSNAAGQPPPAHSGTSATPRRRPISVHITVPFATAIGLSDQPGELEGYGPIPAHVAKVLAAEGVWTWLRTDGSGHLLDLGRTRYRPTKALADFIIARDRTCRIPGCHRPATTCDLDHIIPVNAGGTTDPDDLHALCETHHKLKHHGHWHVERLPDGTTIWISPTGHRYEKPPERIGSCAETAIGHGDADNLG